MGAWNKSTLSSTNPCCRHKQGIQQEHPQRQTKTIIEQPAENTNSPVMRCLKNNKGSTSASNVFRGLGDFPLRHAQHRTLIDATTYTPSLSLLAKTARAPWSKAGTWRHLGCWEPRRRRFGCSASCPSSRPPTSPPVLPAPRRSGVTHSRGMATFKLLFRIRLVVRFNCCGFCVNNNGERSEGMRTE